MSLIADDPSRLAAALDKGESLPAHWYTDPSISQQEIHRIFRRSWIYIGPLAELAAPGDYITGDAGEVPVVAIRNERGLAGFVNVCRHRRHLVMQGRGNAAIMRCMYHAWAYDLDGRLKAAPRSAAEPGFRLEAYPLLPVRAEALGPFVLVNLDPEAPPVASCFGAVLDIIAGSGIDLATLRLHSREDWASHSNWKTMLENYLECYHCPIAHPGFGAAIDVRPENYDLTAHGWFLSQIGQVRQSALEGRSAMKIYDVGGRVHAFGRQMRELTARHPAMQVHVRYSHPDPRDRLGVSHDGEGHITPELLREILPFGDYDFYLCGPSGFMQLLYDGLIGLGVRRERIHFESFGTGAALRIAPKPEAPAAPVSGSGSAIVRFAKSAVTARWSPDQGTLLDLAETAGLAPAFGCRPGICGTCATPIAAGTVEYLEEPLAPHGEGEILLCCSTPSLDARQQTGTNPAIVLSL